MSGTSPHNAQSDSSPPSTERGRPPPDEQTRRLQEENQALRELLAAQVQAQLPPARAPHPLKRLCWWLISAPGAAMARWLRALRREAPPITGRKLGCATITVLYTLTIYGALVLLVVYWSTPNGSHVAMPAANPVPLPLQALPALQAESLPSPAPAGEEAPSVPPVPAPPREERPPAPPLPEPPGAEKPASPRPDSPASADPPRAPHEDADAAPRASAAPDDDAPGTPAAAPAAAGPRSALRITEIPAQDPQAWLRELRQALQACAERGFFERPECAWDARERYCAPHRAWGSVKECPARP